MQGGVFGGKGVDAGSASERLTEEAVGELQNGRMMRHLALRQGEEVLKTGAVPQYQVPIINQALEQVLMAGSKARTDAESRVAAAGLGRTPQGTRILTDTDFSNALQAAIVPMNLSQQLRETAINRGVGVSMGQLAPSLQGLGTAAGVTGGIQSTQIQAETAFWNEFMKQMNENMRQAMKSSSFGGMFGGG